MKWPLLTFCSVGALCIAGFTEVFQDHNAIAFAGLTETFQNDEEIASAPKSQIDDNWFVSYINRNPQRNYFTHFFGKGGFRKGIEIGVQDGRFSELFLQQNVGLRNWSFVLVDPKPTDFFLSRFGVNGAGGSWEQKGYLKNVNLTFEETMSTDPQLLAKYPDGYFDFVYLDALHTHDAVKAELPVWWNKVRRGGIMAGHDYCNYGESGLACSGCDDIPECVPYTSYGMESAERKKGRSANQQGVVSAVQE